MADTSEGQRDISPSHVHDEQKDGGQKQHEQHHVSPSHEHGGENHHSAPSHEHGGEKHGGKRKMFDLFRRLKSGDRRERLENASYLMIMLSAVMVGIGIALGSFVMYTVYIGAAGALLVLVGIVIYIVSQLMAGEKGTGAGASPSGSVKVVDYRTDVR